MLQQVISIHMNGWKGTSEFVKEHVEHDIVIMKEVGPGKVKARARR